MSFPASSAATHAPLTVVARAGHVESVHAGSVAVVDLQGRLLYGAGTPNVLTFTRSALKPLQALPFVAAGGVERFRLHAARGRVAVRESFRRATPCRRRGRDAGQGGQLRRGSPVRHARSLLLRDERRSPAAAAVFAAWATTARASTAACWRTAPRAATRSTITWPTTIRLQQEIRRAVAAFAGVPEDTLVAGRGRLLRTQLRAAARPPGAGVRPAGRGRGRRRLRSRSADARRRDDRAPGDGVGRAPHRPRAYPAPAAATGCARSVRKASRPSASRAAVGVSPSRSPTATREDCMPAVVAVLEQLGLLDDAARRALAPWARPGSGITVASPPGEARGVVVLDKIDRRRHSRGAGCRPMNLRPLQQSVTASVRCGLDQASPGSKGRGSAGCRTCRSAG